MGLSSWGAAAEDVGDDDWNTTIGVGLQAVGVGIMAAFGWTGVGAAVGGVVTGAGTYMVADEAVEAVGQLYSSAYTPHLGKIMQSIKVADTENNVFAGDAALIDAYGTADFGDMDQATIQQAFVDAVLGGQGAGGTNDFISSLEKLSNLQQDEETAMFNSEITEHLNNAVTAGYGVQEELGKLGYSSDDAVLQEMRTLKGIRAGILGSSKYEVFRKTQAKGDAGTYERLQTVRDSIIKQQEKKQQAGTRYSATTEMLTEAMRGTSAETILKGEQNAFDDTTIMKFEQFMSDGDHNLKVDSGDMVRPESAADISNIKKNIWRLFVQEIF